MVQTYTTAIASVHDQFPDLPPTIGWLELNHTIQQGAPIEHHNLQHARHVADALESYKNAGNDLITEDVLESAKLRVHAITDAHSQARYGPNVTLLQIHEQINGFQRQMQQQINGVQVQLNERIDGVEHRLSITNTHIENIRIIGRNKNRGELDGYYYLKKTTPGVGITRAIQLRPTSGNVSVNAPEATAAIGDVPFNTLFYPRGLTHQRILDLIIFYNDDFGIQLDDDIDVRIGRVIHFLVAL